MLFQDYSPVDARTIRYGIDTKKIEEFKELNGDREQIREDLGMGESDFVILCIATFEPRKQQTVLALAMSQILRNDPETSIRLLLVGDSSSEYSNAVKDYVRTAGLEKVVRIEPIVPDPFPYYAAADLVILYSDIESMPRTLLEAMCFARPVLAASVFGVTELITDGTTGFCTEVNSLQSLTASIEQVCAQDQGDLARIGSAAREEILKTYDSSGYAGEVWKLISAGVNSGS
jgi:glycosyltransferase involved in cell wall biosynthesis